MGLENKIIISTKTLDEDDLFKNYLSSKGAIVIDFPMIEIYPVEINNEIRNTINNLNSFQWIIFTSKNGVTQFFKIKSQLSALSSQFSAKIAAIGNKTGSEITGRGYKPELISSGNTAEDLLQQMQAHISKQQSESPHNTKPDILLALGVLASDVLEKGLADIANVTRINLYDTGEPDDYSEEVVESIRNDKYDIVAFTSPSQVRNFLKITNFAMLLKNNKSVKAKFACIGRTTEKEIVKNGFTALVVSPESDALTFAKEIEKYLTSKIVNRKS